MQLLSCRSTCRNVWLTAGRSALHVGVRSALADITLVAFVDPWMEDGNSLDLTDSAEDRVHVPLAFTRDHAEWLTADDRPFARGTGQA